MRYRDLFLSRGLQVLIFRLVAARQPFGPRFFCYEFSLRFTNLIFSAISERNVVNGIISFFFVHLVFRFWKNLA